MQVRAAQTRRALMLAAARLIDDRGMKGTGLLDISRAAGVSKGALYFHFASKDDLVTALRSEARSSVVALAEQFLDGPSSTLAGAARFTDAMSARMREDPVLRAGLRLESEACGSRPDAEESNGAAEPQSLRDGWVSVLRRQLDKDASDGRLRPGCGAVDTANLIAAVTVGLEALGRDDDTWWDPEVTAGIWRLLLMLVGPQGGSDSAMAAGPDRTPERLATVPEQVIREEVAVLEGALRAGAPCEGVVREG
jgi:AcrR family transcriptional regulator